VTGNPTQQVFWFASQALGIVAILMLGISVAVGLAMSSRIIRRPGLPSKLKRFHEASTLVTLGMISGHAGLLLFDGYLRPGLGGIMLPFALRYRPVLTGIGVIAGWLAVILGLSFYARRRIGVKTWRFMHRFTIVVYLLALGHAVGAGTHGGSWWMLAMLTALTAPIVFAFAYRMLPAARTSAAPPRSATNGPSTLPSARLVHAGWR
jgi:sulfoxide reductase heme-binding subunit YedZ